MADRKIILASTSPRRKALLAKAGLEFEVAASGYEENMDSRLAPSELAKCLSYGKAAAVAAHQEGALVIGADTFIVLDGRLLGKPHDAERALAMLRSLNGRDHAVITGFTVIDTTTQRFASEAVETKVYFRNLTEKEMADYVATGEPLDKAGAYAIQGLGAALIDRIEGDYDNVVGLPVSALSKCLHEFDQGIF